MLGAGLYVAIGGEKNILIRVDGIPPMLTILGGIDLNKFYKTGDVKKLESDSIEILDILKNPSEYTYVKPNVPDSLEFATDDKVQFESIENIDIDTNKKIRYQHRFQYLYGFYGDYNKAKNTLTCEIKRECKISLNQARTIFSLIVKPLLPDKK